MGGGDYSTLRRSYRADTEGYKTKSADQIFKQRKIHADMNPKGVLIRESRDSADHPMSIPIIVALDVTGSMGMIPHDFVKDGLPTLVSTLIQDGVADPAILFLAIGDITYDEAPLQVGQFESSDELLDKWLTSVWIEKKGGGNDGESYTLAHYFAGYHTVHDHLEKRGKKGFLFTIGDEPALEEISARSLSELMGGGQFGSLKAKNLIDKASEKYEVFHLHVRQGSNGLRREVVEGWQNLLGQRCIEVSDYTQIPHLIAETIISNIKKDGSIKLNPVQSVSDKPEEPSYVSGPVL